MEPWSVEAASWPLHSLQAQVPRIIVMCVCVFVLAEAVSGRVNAALGHGAHGAHH